MRNDKALNDTQICEVIRTEMGSKESPFGVQMIRRLFGTFIVKENDTNPKQFKKYARKMGSSVQMLMDNYAQVPDNENKEEYQGVGDLSSGAQEPPKKRAKKQRK